MKFSVTLQMKEHGSFISIWIYALLLVLLIGGFVVINIYCSKSSQKLRTYTFTKDTLNIPQDKLSINISISKEWTDNTLHPKEPSGAQYDGILTNNSNLTFKDWSAKLTFSKPIYIDSSWNGDFTSSRNELTFVAKGDPATVAPHSIATFGAIMYATNLMTLEKYTLSGYRILTPTDIPLFRLLVFLSILWILAIVMHFTLELKTRKYRRRQELDSKIIRQSMNTFTGFIDAKDAYTKGHSVRVAEYASEIARRMKMEQHKITNLYYISLMHDCGKIGIPDAVLQKPDRLTDEEYKLIQSHTIKGDAILIDFTAIPDIRDGAHFHHERFDGKGYPTGLRGADIPLCARIICVADSFDAMNSNRCYRNQLNKEKIRSELIENAGKQFDPQIVPFMVSMIDDGFVQKVQTQYPGTSS